MQKRSYCHNPGSFPLVPYTLGDLLDIAADCWGDNEAIISVYEKQHLTYEEVHDKVTKLAAGLLHLGLKPGDRVGIWSYNCVQWYITYMAIAKAGLITVTLNPESEPPELLYCLKKVQVKALVCAERRDSESCYDLVSKIIPELSSCQSSDVEFHSAEIPSLTSLIIMSDQKFPGAYRLQDIVAFATPESLKRSEEVQKMVQPDEGCLIIFSSGTTGKQKGALLNHHSIINNAVDYVRRLNLSKATKHRFCLSTQFCHISASCCSVIPALHIGGAVVIPGYKYDPIELLKAVKAEKCTAMLSLPSLYTKMVNAVKEDPELASDSFEVCVLGGANASPSQLHDVLKYIRAARVVSIYGMTEIGPMAFQTLSTDSLEKISSTTGCVLEHVEAKVVDSEGRMVPMGTPGEIWIRGCGNMMCYWGEEDKTLEAKTATGWIKTGDMFILQEDGYGKVVGRLKDMIKRENINIFPIDIENILLKHPGVLEVQAFGVPDPNVGEEMFVYILPKKDFKLEEQDIRKFCEGKIAKFKIPRYIRVTDEFPRTGTGKPQKFQLRQRALHELGLQDISFQK
ncbi:medium-chain acyl-CoA ligase ACSF2, mitochondrial-like [Periplaneta americana]|uniref:medium-chain acyl-CoA ligase ACSF2, mitochondrial-like n=1 Tax=Periplaneta americana TaxID=6978 RepID=UPI0037E82123